MTRSPTSTIGPRRIGKRSVLIAGGAIGLIAAAIWAAAPLRLPAIETGPERSPVALASSESVEPLDIDAFRAPLWVAPPAPPEPEPEPEPERPPPPPPLRVELIAIVAESGVFSAILYDPTADSVLVVKAGHELSGGRVVEAIDATGLSVAGPRGVQRLALAGEDRR